MTTKTTTELIPGDRLIVAKGIERTVSKVTDSGYLNHSNKPILNVHYAEGNTPEWSGGNLGAEDSVWTLADSCHGCGHLSDLHSWSRDGSPCGLCRCGDYLTVA